MNIKVLKVIKLNNICQKRRRKKLKQQKMIKVPKRAKICKNKNIKKCQRSKKVFKGIQNLQKVKKKSCPKVHKRGECQCFGSTLHNEQCNLFSTYCTRPGQD